MDAASGVLANDTDPDLDALQAVLVDDVSNGTLSLSSDGSFDYTPDPDFSGEDSFTYRASDTVLSSNLATVTLPDGRVFSALTLDEDGADVALEADEGIYLTETKGYLRLVLAHSLDGDIILTVNESDDKDEHLDLIDFA